MVEPVQGEGGVYPGTEEFIVGLRKLCDEKGLLLLFDEVQTGFGRTGEIMGYMNYGVKPDIVSMAKALGGGLPIGAICATAEVAKAFTPGSHGCTFSGNPVVCAAAMAQIDELIDNNLSENAKEMGNYFMDKLATLPNVKEVRGKGLLVGVEFNEPLSSADIKHGCVDRGLLVTAVGKSIIRMLPPLIVTKEECDKAYSILKEAVEALM
jgi:acetylornithine/N-succinyldiaminopimelate aminotransferase